MRGTGCVTHEEGQQKPSGCLHATWDLESWRLHQADRFATILLLIYAQIKDGGWKT